LVILEQTAISETLKSGKDNGKVKSVNDARIARLQKQKEKKEDREKELDGKGVQIRL